MKKCTLLFIAIALMAQLPALAQEVVLNLTGMTPHVGQLFEIRIVDKATMEEEDREKVNSISGPDFSVTLDGELGASYFVDFYADLNQNGFYDAPPADHAWRLEIDEIGAGTNSLDFPHGTNFTDIEWKHELEFQLTGMTPHVGQQFGVRLVDTQTGEEAGREDIDAIESADFQVDLPFLTPGRTYNLDFYADLNQNGLYDTPPTDHAWRMQVGPVDGDAVANFPHGTDFTDIAWVYEFRLEFFNMNPHVGQKLELRIVNTSTNEEIGRATVPEIQLPDFEVRVPGIQVGENYNADFYADLNQNGTYDAPPTDHAWRINFDDDDGDESREFTHNTDFTDIAFPTTAVREISSLAGWSIFPNPVKETFRMDIKLRESALVKAALYDQRGILIRPVFEERLPARESSFEVEGLERLSPGTYFLVLQSGGGTAVKTVLKH